MDVWPDFRRTISYLTMPRDLILTLWDRARGIQ
jgi:hypothetical protein